MYGRVSGYHSLDQICVPTPPNPAPLGPRITLPDTLFPELPAKTGTLLHTFTGKRQFNRIYANRSVLPGAVKC